MSVSSLCRLLLFSVSVLVVLSGMATTPVSAATTDSGTVSAQRADGPAARAAKAGSDLRWSDAPRKGKGKKGRNGGKGGGKIGGATSTPTATATPTATPSATSTPTATPTATATATPTATPTPTAAATPPTVATPTATVTPEPTVAPTTAPTTEPTTAPTSEPTTEPTVLPTVEPTVAPAPAYYVDPATGSDSNTGTSPERAWRTLGRASAAELLPGDLLRLKAGTTHVGALALTEDGTASEPITVEAYGDGSAPRLTGPSGETCVRLAGDWITVRGLHAADCGRAGFRVEGADITLRGVEASGSVAGIWIRSGALRATVVDSDIRDNDMMAPNTPGSDDDYGAFGIEVNGDGTRVIGNRISGHHALSPDYRVDGAAVEVYQAKGTLIEGNTSTDDLAFTELGGSRSSGTTVVNNTVTSSAEEGTFLMTRGAGQVWGPVVDTIARGNTVVLTGAKSYGFACYGGCTPTNLVMKDNSISAGWYVGWVDGSFTTTGNTYRGDLWFTLGSGDTLLR